MSLFHHMMNKKWDGSPSKEKLNSSNIEVYLSLNHFKEFLVIFFLVIVVLKKDTRKIRISEYTGFNKSPGTHVYKQRKSRSCVYTCGRHLTRRSKPVVIDPSFPHALRLSPASAADQSASAKCRSEEHYSGSSGCCKHRCILQQRPHSIAFSGGSEPSPSPRVLKSMRMHGKYRIK
jgi:hypothetical protein